MSKEEMVRVIGVEQVAPSPQHMRFDQSQWSAVVPAAGLGSRLGYHLPKVLYPILGKPIITWLAELLTPHCSDIVIVVSPEGEPQISQYIKKQQINVRIEVQQKPDGMASAIASGLKNVFNPNVIVIWGDQVTASSTTLAACQHMHELHQNTLLVLPTLLKDMPYIHFKRDSDKRITEVLQRRENDVMPTVGENDCGVFLFDVPCLKAVLTTTLAQRNGLGSTTGEFNLLPLIPQFEEVDESGGVLEQALEALEALEAKVVTVRITDAYQTLGINTVSDAELVSRYLQQRDKI